MHAIVCLKQVPDTTEVKIDPERGTLIREGIPAIINPFDTYAIEEAVLLKERFGGKVTVITMGPPQAEDALREAVAVGCDEAVLLSDPKLAGSDTWATSYTLAQAIRRLGQYDLILCGRQAIDGDTGQVGPGVAQHLGITPLTYISKLLEVDFEARRIRAQRLLEEGREQVVAPIPALLTVLKDINIPRTPTFMGIRRARRAVITSWTAADLSEGGADESCFGLPGSPTRVVKVFTPPAPAGSCHFPSGKTPEEKAERLAERLLGDGAI